MGLIHFANGAVISAIAGSAKAITNAGNLGDFFVDAAGAVTDAAGRVIGNIDPNLGIKDPEAARNQILSMVGIGNNSQSSSQSPLQTTSGSYAGDPNITNGADLAPFTYATSGGGSSSGGNSTSTPNLNVLQQISTKLGYSTQDAQNILDAANAGNVNAIKLLASAGIQPFADYVNAANASSGGSGGGGTSYSPLTQVQTRQALALFDPNYPDGAWIPMPDGTMRLNGTQIVIDTRAKGQYKPVDGAPGYLVDPITGNIIDTNGNQIARDQLQATIQNNLANQDLNKYSTDVSAELGRNKNAIDIAGLNLQAATSENEQKLKNILETEGLNLQSFLGTGNLNIGATNAETNRLNALTQRSAAGGSLASDLQKLQDARTMAVIQLMANPQDFVQREYASRALNAPAGYTGPAFRDNPQIQQFIDQLASTPNVDSLLPTYNAPSYQPVSLPNASLPRADSSILQPQAQLQAPVGSATKTNTPATQQQSSDYFRSQGVPDWALTPLGLAYGTDNQGTSERQFIVGDPQRGQSWEQVNPEMVNIHNPGPNTTAEVTPLRNMMFEGMPQNNGNTPGGWTRMHQWMNQPNAVNWFASLANNLPWMQQGNFGGYRQPQNTLGINPTQDNNGLSYFAYGTDYNPTPGNANIDSQGNYTGSRDYAGNPLGTITTYSDSAIRNLPGVQYALGNLNPAQYNTLNTGKITGAFGTQLPDVGGLNYGQLLNIASDPSSWGVLQSLYNSANRDLQGIFNRVQARAPIGQITQPSLIRTGV